ncbi:MAG: ABC transporter permease, partial [Marinilabiliales bacterium]|nr:ABC transporter permease [Marinilabiliales bacterium]
MRNLLLAFRTLRRNPLLLYISIPGLAIGLCAFLLLAVQLKYEFSFDRHFPTGERVVRLCNVMHDPDRTRDLAIGLRTAYTQLPGQVPEIEKAVQLYPETNAVLKSAKDSYSGLNLLYTDPEFFDVFGIKLLVGNPSDALIGKNNIVLAQSTAIKIFGRTNCVGQTVSLNGGQLVVSGVTEDLPKTTHFAFDMLRPLTSHEYIASQGSLEFRTYYLIREGVDRETTIHHIAAANDQLMLVWKTRGSLNNLKSETTVERLRDIHLLTKTLGDMVPKTNLSLLFILIGIALFILLIALINFIHLYLLHG